MHQPGGRVTVETPASVWWRPYRRPPVPTAALDAPADIAVSLIAHRVLHPARTETARRVTAWMLGAGDLGGTADRAAAKLAVALCRQTPAPASVRAIAAELTAVTLIDAHHLSQAIAASGLTSTPVPLTGLVRLTRLWHLPPVGVKAHRLDETSLAVGEAGRALIRTVTNALTAAGGPIPSAKAHLFTTGAVSEWVTRLARAEVHAGWLSTVTALPPSRGMGYLTARLLRGAPQTAETILAAAGNRQALPATFPRPPVPAVNAWLQRQPWCTVRAGVIRARGDLGLPSHRLDDICTAAIRGNPDRPTTLAELHAAILAAGYAPSGVSYLVHSNPILQRVGVGLYRVRRAPRGGVPDLA